MNGEARAFADDLLDRGGGLFGWVLATREAERVAARLRQSGLSEAATSSMSRARPDGTVLSWKLVNGGPGTPPGMPGIIDWDASDEDRLRWEPPATHPNGVRSVAGVVVALRDPERMN